MEFVNSLISGLLLITLATSLSYLILTIIFNNGETWKKVISTASIPLSAVSFNYLQHHSLGDIIQELDWVNHPNEQFTLAVGVIIGVLSLVALMSWIISRGIQRLVRTSK